jgi:hypothetical protein
MKRERLTAVMKYDGSTPLWNQYDCTDCKAAGFDHDVVDVPGPSTDKRSCWGAGLPTTMRECTCCKRQDGPWVSSDIVGGGW